MRKVESVLAHEQALLRRLKRNLGIALDALKSILEGVFVAQELRVAYGHFSRECCVTMGQTEQRFHLKLGLQQHNLLVVDNGSLELKALHQESLCSCVLIGRVRSPGEVQASLFALTRGRLQRVSG